MNTERIPIHVSTLEALNTAMDDKIPVILLERTLYAALGELLPRLKQAGYQCLCRGERGGLMFGYRG